MEHVRLLDHFSSVGFPVKFHNLIVLIVSPPTHFLFFAIIYTKTNSYLSSKNVLPFPVFFFFFIFGLPNSSSPLSLIYSSSSKLPLIWLSLFNCDFLFNRRVSSKFLINSCKSCSVIASCHALSSLSLNTLGNRKVYIVGY